MSDRAHYEHAKKSMKVNRMYCVKEGDYEEFGHCSSVEGLENVRTELKTG